MSNPVVSIIVPCYKQAYLLPETINSILQQTYSNWECIIVNDGSPDNTEEVASEICSKDKRIKLLSQENQGLAMARNNGIRFSEGEYILPLDSDDLIEPTYLEKAIQRFNEYPETKLVYCKADRFDEKKEYWNLPKYTYEDEIWENRIFCSSIYRRSDYDKTIGYNPNMKGGLEDWDFWLSLLKPEDIVYQIDEILFHYRYKKGSMFTQTTKKTDYLYRTLFHNHRDIYEKYCEEIILLKNMEKSYIKINQSKIFLFFKKIRNLFFKIKK